MIYFDNAATSHFHPDSVTCALVAAVKSSANAGRSGHALSMACAERVYAVRESLNDFFNGYGAERVIFNSGCTEGLNTVILGSLKKGDEVLTTVAEHNSVLRPLRHLSTKGVKVAFAKLNNFGGVDLDDVIAKITPKTKAIVITLCSNVTGALTDITYLRERIAPNIWLICDGAQACGHVQIDMKKLGIDALAVAGHKGMMSIQGSGALLLSKRIEVEPIKFGGTGSESFSLNMPSYYPDKLESGTLSYPAIMALGEATLYLKSHFFEQRDKLIFLANKLREGLEKIPNVHIYSPMNEVGIVAFNCYNIPSENVATLLSEKYSIYVRGGLHCAPLIHKALGSERVGVVRASLSHYNSINEVDAFLNALEAICK